MADRRAEEPVSDALHIVPCSVVALNQARTRRATYLAVTAGTGTTRRIPALGVTWSQHYPVSVRCAR